MPPKQASNPPAQSAPSSSAAVAAASLRALKAIRAKQQQQQQQQADAATSSAAAPPPPPPPATPPAAAAAAVAGKKKRLKPLSDAASSPAPAPAAAPAASTHAPAVAQAAAPAPTAAPTPAQPSALDPVAASAHVAASASASAQPLHHKPSLASDLHTEPFSSTSISSSASAASSASDSGSDSPADGDPLQQDEDEEDAEDYKKGGYHPVNIGDRFSNNRYTVVRKLGWGHFSTVWLAKDHKYNRPAALKIVKSAQHYTETALDEIKLLEKVVKANPADPHREYIVELYDSFKHSGPNGTHVAMAFEVLGPNLLTMIRRYHHRGIPIDIVKRIVKQVLMGLDYLHTECNIIHTDLKPENILIAIDVPDTMRQLGLHDMVPASNATAEAAAAASATASAATASAATTAQKKDHEEKPVPPPIPVPLAKPGTLPTRDSLTTLRPSDSLEMVDARSSVTSLPVPSIRIDASVTTLAASTASASDVAPMSITTATSARSAMAESATTAGVKTPQSQGSPMSPGDDAFVMVDSPGKTKTKAQKKKAKYRAKKAAAKRAVLGTASGTASAGNGEDIVAGVSGAGKTGDAAEDGDDADSVSSSIFEGYTPPAAAAMAPPTQPPAGAHARAAQPASPPSHPTLAQRRALEDTGSVMSSDDSMAMRPTLSPSMSMGGSVDHLTAHHIKQTDMLGKTLSDISLVDASEAEADVGRADAAASAGIITSTLNATATAAVVATAVAVGGAADGALATALDAQPMDSSPVHDSLDRKRRRNESNTNESNKRSDANVVVKIADLGNACWTHHHFTADIQTRQYRSPEVILGAPYDTSADLWSLGCITFELLTGDYLFDPHSGSRYSKDDDHVAQMIELLGPFPKHFALSGKFSADVFNRRGELRHIHKLRIWKLADVLREKYHFSAADSAAISSFIMPMIEAVPSKR
ncbi:kinase-like domain-containing protein [Entophlyctis helioformis]|nr:kinase-like domain-containing protein [Entophlyctis helioformis]